MTAVQHQVDVVKDQTKGNCCHSNPLNNNEDGLDLHISKWVLFIRGLV